MTARCLYGLLVKYHYDRRNRRLACGVARILHPRARVARRALRSLLALSERRAS